MINMKKGILIGSASVFVLVLAVVFSGNVNSVKYYEPRETAFNQDGAHGAAEWLHKIRANQITGKVSQEDVDKAYEQVALLKSKKKTSALNLQWEEMGPSTIGGRTRAILIDPSNSQIMFAGAVSGGLFKTTNGGSTWSKVDGAGNPIITSLAMASNGDIYYGTGEGMYSGTGGEGGSGFRGEGVFKSTDGGSSFTQLSATAGWVAVGKVAVDPANNQRVYAATSVGLKVSDDAGNTWQDAFNAFPSSARDLFVTSTGKVWVKQGAGVYRSDNGNPQSFSLAPGLPSISGRARIAASPQDDDYVYVIACTPGGGTIGGEFDKAYQSKDGGDTWTVIGQQSSLLNPHAAQGNPQGGYNNLLGVSPLDKERIFVGGVTLWEWSSTNGWLQIASLSDNPGNVFYVHADNHEIVFDPADPTKIFIGNDGGIFKSSDNGFTWSWEVRNYVTTQFYNIAVGIDGEMLGGTQDNGTIFINPAFQFPKSGIRTSGILLNGVERDGDGGYAEISRLDPDILFKEMQYGLMGRSTDGGETFDYVLTNKVIADSRVGSAAFAPFVTPFTLWENRFDPLSEDSITFTADSVFLSIGFGNGGASYSGTMVPSQKNADLIPEGLIIRVGSRRVVSDANGNLSGDGTGTYDDATGRFSVNFNQPVSLEITAKAAVRYYQDSLITVKSTTNELPINHVLDSDLGPGESIKIQDPAQSMLFIAVTAYPGDPSGLDKNEFGGIWMTRKSLSDVDGPPSWYHVAKLSPPPSGLNIQTMTVSADGNTLWAGSDNGRLYRITNLEAARDSASISVNDLYLGGVLSRPATSVIQTDLVNNFAGRAITAIAVHPDDPNKVAVTVGSYGNQDYVFMSSDALTGANFTTVQGDLPKMPAYSITFNFTNTTNPNQLIVGTEAGVYVTDDATAGNPDWTIETTGMDNVPVFDLIQDRAIRIDVKYGTRREGDIYAGTHGRGIFKTTTTSEEIGVEELQNVEEEAKSVMEIFPNPASSRVSVSLNLENRSDISLTIRDINGKLVKTQSYKKLDRETPNISFDVSRLAIGTYILTLQEGEKVRTGKLVVAR